IGTEEHSHTGILDRQTYALSSEFITTIQGSIGDVVVTDVLENGVSIGGTSAAGLSYETEVVSEIFTSESTLYKSEILGIRFSGIDLPTEEELNGEKVIGYYIVRAERTEDDKTILDTAVLAP